MAEGIIAASILHFVVLGLLTFLTFMSLLLAILPCHRTQIGQFLIFGALTAFAEKSAPVRPSEPRSNCSLACETELVGFFFNEWESHICFTKYAYLCAQNQLEDLVFANTCMVYVYQNATSESLFILFPYLV